MEAKKGIKTYDGATAIVTGGASGIGQTIAEELARRGCEVVLADFQWEAAKEVAEGIRATGGKATAVKLDVTDGPAVAQVVRDTVMRTGRLDYIFNNAGILITGGIHHYTIADWDQIVNVNIRGIINGVHAAYPVMMMQGFGHIVNTASIAGLIPDPGQVAYATTKHAVVGLSKSLRAEAGLSGIRVSVLCPGIISTPMTNDGGKFGKTYSDISPELRKQMLKEVSPMRPDLFAKKVLDAVAKNRAIIVEPAWWKWFWRIDRLLPEYSILLSQKTYKRTLTKLGLWPYSSQ